MFPDFGKIAEDSADMLATQKAILNALQGIDMNHANIINELREINAKMEMFYRVRTELESPAKTLPGAIGDI